MTFKEYDTITDKFIKDILEMAKQKGYQYANSKDRLDNFKRLAQQLGTTPELIAMVYMTKHWDSINWAIRTKNYKDIDGRIADLINYALLLRAIIYEEES